MWKKEYEWRVIGGDVGKWYKLEGKQDIWDLLERYPFFKVEIQVKDWVEHIERDKK